VLAHLLLGRNIFKAPTAEESRQRIMTMPIPDFRKLDERIDDSLNEIIQRCLARDLDKRYQTATSCSMIWNITFTTAATDQRMRRSEIYPRDVRPERSSVGS